MGIKQDSKVIAWHFDISNIFVNKKWEWKEDIPALRDEDGEEWCGFYTERPFLFTKTKLSGEDLRKEPFLGFDLLKEYIRMSDIDQYEELYGLSLKKRKMDFVKKYGQFDFPEYEDDLVDMTMQEIKEDRNWSDEYFNKVLMWDKQWSKAYKDYHSKKHDYVRKFLNQYGDFYGTINDSRGKLIFRSDDPIVQRIYPPKYFGNTPKPFTEKTDRKGYWIDIKDFKFEVLSLLLVTEIWTSLTSPDSPSPHHKLSREQYITTLAQRWVNHFEVNFIIREIGLSIKHSESFLKRDFAVKHLGKVLAENSFMRSHDDWKNIKISEEKKFTLIESIMLYFTQKHNTNSSLKAVKTEAGTTVKELVIVKSIGDFYWSNIKYTMLAQQGVSICQYAKCQKYFLREKSNQNYCLEKTGNDCQVKAKELRRYERNKQWKKGRNG